MQTSEILITLIMSAYAWIFFRMNKRLDQVEVSEKINKKLDQLEMQDKKHDEAVTIIKVSLARIETDLKYLVSNYKR